MRLYLFAALIAGLSPVAAAAPDWYQVEALLFDYVEPDTQGELWLENPGLPLRSDTIQLRVGATDDNTPGSAVTSRLAPYQSLPARFYQLRAAYRQLRLSAEYRPLLHVAWQQPGMDERQALAVRLDNTLFADAQSAAAPPQLRTAATQADTGSVGVEPHVYRPPEILYDGLVRLRRSRFLHLDVDFAYFPKAGRLPTPDPGSGAAPSRQAADYVRLTESRRIRLDKTYYFDHPMFGLLVTVTQVASAD